MNATTTHPLHLDSATMTRDAGEHGGVSGAPRALLRLEGGAALVGATLGFAALGGRWSVFALLFLVPDLSMLGYLVNRRVGAIAYNAAHSYVAPALVAALGATLGHGAFAVACIWVAHVGFDRLLGYGLKYGTSFGDTHLGAIGAARSTTPARGS